MDSIPSSLAVAHVLPAVPHQLCHFHYLREAAKPVYEADKHAKKELKKHLRGVRPLERAVEQRGDPEADAIRGYCLAVRSAMLSTFRKVTTSYWPGLFHCYDHADLPRTNNELEQYFGSARYHERRTSCIVFVEPTSGQEIWSGGTSCEMS